MKIRYNMQLLLAILITAVFTACSGGGGSSSSPGGTPSTDSNSLTSSVINSAPADVCPTGGITVNVGATSTQYICNALTAVAPSAPSGSSCGKNGYTSLVSMVSEPSGANCTNGGVKISVGLDTNCNGILDSSEVTSTKYVCNGANGTNGTNGLTTLMNIVSEPTGTICAAGGLKVTSGLDSNGNSVLDPGEVMSTNYVCNGTNGTNGLTTLMNMVAESAGANCAYGGQKITSGLDANSNGILESSEITSTNYVCNGAPGSAGSGITWVDVTGTSIQAVPNTGYMADSLSQVTITLPVSPSLGDIVQVSGVGKGGWKIAQNDLQSIVTQDLVTVGAVGAVWTRANTTSSWWHSVASSADGTRLAVVGQGNEILTSTDSGVSWTLRHVGGDNTVLMNVASSSDGSKLVTADRYGGIYTSDSFAVYWALTTAPTLSWSFVASSSNGTKLVAAASYGEGLYTSSNSGFTWTRQTSAPTNLELVASSADGTKLVASGNYFSGIYTSSNSGVTWTLTSAPTANWSSFASSADGTKLVAAVYGGGIYTSVDSGVTWTLTSAPTAHWSSIASSADGTKLVAAIGDGWIYISSNSGDTWTLQASAPTNVNCVASSADGTKLVAGNNIEIYTTSGPTDIQSTTVGTAGWISGDQYDAIELQYIGNNTFTVLSHEGYLVVQ